MLKKRIKYNDIFDGEEKEQDFYFNLTKAEIAEMEMSVDGGMVKTIERIVEEQDKKKLIELFKGLILASYGERTADGHFDKSELIRERFSHSEAYSVLFMELASNEQAAIAFVNGVIPKVPSPAK